MFDSNKLWDAAHEAMARPVMLGRDPCYGLMRHLYAACGVTLPDFWRDPDEARGDGMLRGVEFFGNHFSPATGHEPGDVIVWTDPRPHVAVFLDATHAVHAGDMISVAINRASLLLSQADAKVYRYAG